MYVIISEYITLKTTNKPLVFRQLNHKTQNQGFKQLSFEEMIKIT